MNNAGLSLERATPETNAELVPKLRTEETRLVRIIEALQEVQKTQAWSTLKTEVFENLVNVLEKDLRTEAKKDDPDPKKLNRTSGELKWAERYSDLSKLEHTYRVQLLNVRKQLHGNTE